MEDKLTRRSQEALSDAVRRATAEGNPHVDPLHLLAALPSLRRGLVMVQAEVAERMCAGPGSRVYGAPSVKLAWYAAVRSAGDGAIPVSALSQGSERWNRSQAMVIESCRWSAGTLHSCWISRRGEPERIRVPPPPGATGPMKLTTNSPLG